MRKVLTGAFALYTPQMRILPGLISRGYAAADQGDPDGQRRAQSDGEKEWLASHRVRDRCSTQIEACRPVEKARKSLVWVITTYGFDGGCLWQRVDFETKEESDRCLAVPVKLRGVEFRYNTVKTVLEALYTLWEYQDPDFDPGAPVN